MKVWICLFSGRERKGEEIESKSLVSQDQSPPTAGGLQADGTGNGRTECPIRLSRHKTLRLWAKTVQIT